MHTDKKGGPIEVLVVDDSALVRQVLTKIVDAAPDMRCVGGASDPYVAREMIRELDPDVITLDVEMPRMDGLDFLEKLMRLRPTPVVMVSTLTERGTEVTMRALELGAVDFVAKPRLAQATGLQEAGAELLDKIRVAARARLRGRTAPPTVAAAGISAPAVRSQAAASATTANDAGVTKGRGSGSSLGLLAIGASTGGTEAIRAVLQALPADFPPILIAQHMPPGFTQSFAQRLDQCCAMTVREAVDGETIRAGQALIAPGGRHLRLERGGGVLRARVGDEAPVNRHRPSVDVLFDSVALARPPGMVALMLTGMGADGAQGMLRMRSAGAYTIGQDEASCVVYGMPREAAAIGAVVQQLPLDRIAAQLKVLAGRH